MFNQSVQKSYCLRFSFNVNNKAILYCVKSVMFNVSFNFADKKKYIWLEQDYKIMSWDTPSPDVF